MRGKKRIAARSQYRESHDLPSNLIGFSGAVNRDLDGVVRFTIAGRVPRGLRGSFDAG